jgi:hypothetical protein
VVYSALWPCLLRDVHSCTEGEVQSTDQSLNEGLVAYAMEQRDLISMPRIHFKYLWVGFQCGLQQRKFRMVSTVPLRSLSQRIALLDISH